ncbi:MAG: hypothetical protein HW416_2803 [Chloroflexi bacterium]|nr:hypothetical protein [Chloroflexota bacterium]
MRSRISPMRLARHFAGLALAFVALLVLQPTPGLGQSSATPEVVTGFVSGYEAPQPLPTGPLDQFVQVVDLDPGAATPIHYHLGPGFATILQGEVTHHRLATGRDTVYGPGSTWVEIPEDVHYARDEAVTPATILATFILPRSAEGSIPTAEQPDPQRPPPTVPNAARVPITSTASGYEVTQFLRSYDPGSSTSSQLSPGAQAVVLVVSGSLAVQDGKDATSFETGDWWLETSGSVTTSWNQASPPASAVVSILTPRQ